MVIVHGFVMRAEYDAAQHALAIRFRPRTALLKQRFYHGEPRTIPLCHRESSV